MMTKIKMRGVIWRALFFSVAGFLFLASTPALGETAQAYQWIAQLGKLSFNKGGAANIPGFVVGAMRSGDISPVMQFVMVNSLMNKCIKDTYAGYPRRRDPFKLASAKFSNGLCRINKCFQQGMLILLLPQLSGKQRYGGEAGKQSGGEMGKLLAQSFQKNGACPGGDQAMSQALLQAFLR